MKRKSILILALVVGLALALGLVAGLALARDEDSISAVTAPTVVSYQGEVMVDDAPYNGTGYFKFAIVNTAGTATYWSNDGTSTTGDEPDAAEELSVENGLFAVLLGNSAAPYKMPPITAAVFADKGRRLHVWFSTTSTGTFTDLGLTVVAAVPYAMNAETLDGLDGSSYVKHYSHVIVVAKSGGDYTTIGAALASITDNYPDSRYLVWVGPGTYTETVTMKEYVDIEGAGELLTTISYSGSNAFGTGTVLGADNTELRFLTVRNTGGDDYAVAVYNNDVSPHLIHLTVSASGGSNNSYGVYNENSLSTMTNINVSASGPGDCAGIYNTTFSAATMTDVTASAACSSYSMGVKNSTSSPTMNDVKATASGDYINYGVYNVSSSSPWMVDVIASALGGTWGYGVENMTSSSPTMTRVIASASGASSYNYGVYNGSSSLTIRNSTLIAVGGTGLYNRANSGSYIVTVNNCQITGDDYSLDNDSSTNNYTTNVGASLLDGAVTGTGTEVCVVSYKADYIELKTDCTPPP